MKPEDFCRWLQGYAELAKTRPTPAQWKAIKKHLQLVYTKVTDKPDTEVHRALRGPGARMPGPRGDAHLLVQTSRGYPTVLDFYRPARTCRRHGRSGENPVGSDYSASPVAA